MAEGCEGSAHQQKLEPRSSTCATDSQIVHVAEQRSPPGRAREYFAFELSVAGARRWLRTLDDFIMPATSMEILTLTVSVLSFIGAAGAAVYARHAVKTARTANQIAEASLRFQVLLPALFEYRSAEMLVAIRSLWDFASEHPNEIGESFQSRREEDRIRLATLNGNDHLGYLRTTLDFHRRQVTQFYGFLTSVYDEGGIQRKWIYTHWSKSDLKIIPEVLVPMEKALGQAIGTPASPTTLDRLLRLYNDCPS